MSASRPLKSGKPMNKASRAARFFEHFLILSPPPEYMF